MPSPTKPSGGKEVTLTLKVEEPCFKWQMVFNTFEVERCSIGAIVRVAYALGHTAQEIVPIIVSREGLTHLRKSTEGYLVDLGEEFVPRTPLPVGVRQFSPLFANNVRLARSGGVGEIAFLTVQLHDIAEAAQGKLRREDSVRPIQVALLHSDMSVHQQLILEMISVLDA